MSERELQKRDKFVHSRVSWVGSSQSLQEQNGLRNNEFKFLGYITERDREAWCDHKFASYLSWVARQSIFANLYYCKLTVVLLRQVLEAAKARPDVLLQVGLEYRYIPPVAKLLGQVKENSIGHVRMVAIREHRFPFLVKVRFH